MTDGFLTDGNGVCPICQQEIEDFEIPAECTGDCGCWAEVVPDYAMSPEKELDFNFDGDYDMRYGDIVDDVVRIQQDDMDAEAYYTDDDISLVDGDVDDEDWFDGLDDLDDIEDWKPEQDETWCD